MAFKITYEPINKIQGVVPTTITKETAAEAWATVHGLMRSDERVTINDGLMGWEELKVMAEQEAS